MFKIAIMTVILILIMIMSMYHDYNCDFNHYYHCDGYDGYVQDHYYDYCTVMIDQVINLVIAGINYCDCHYYYCCRC